jgi:hypothetical protein
MTRHRIAVGGQEGGRQYSLRGPARSSFAPTGMIVLTSPAITVRGGANEASRLTYTYRQVQQEKNPEPADGILMPGAPRHAFLQPQWRHRCRHRQRPERCSGTSRPTIPFLDRHLGSSSATPEPRAGGSRWRRFTGSTRSLAGQERLGSPGAAAGSIVSCHRKSRRSLPSDGGWVTWWPQVEKGSSLRRMTTTTSPAAGQGIDASTSPHLLAHASPAPTLDSAREVGRFPPHCWIHVARPPARLPASSNSTARRSAALQRTHLPSHGAQTSASHADSK